jgi:glyoxylase-like metal-dependent hydrolase (beta-lactamase superfamily II)
LFALSGSASLDDESGTARSVPAPEQLRPGIWSLPLPIPIATLGYVISYVFEGDDGLTIVDPGWDHEDGAAALRAGLSSIGHSIEELRLIVGTHWHPDHVGVARFAREQLGTKFALHDLDAGRLSYLSNRRARGGGRSAGSLVAAGVPRQEIDDMGRGSARVPRIADEVDLHFTDGELLPVVDWSLRVIWTPGHTAGHVCLHEERTNLLLSGDHVLPRITPNIGYDAAVDEGRNPVAEYVSSLGRLSGLHPDEVLPAHLWRFEDLDGRVGELRAHHEQRLDEMRRAVAAGSQTTWEVAQAVSWSRPWEQFTTSMKYFALSETLAHLVYLEYSSEVQQEPGSPDRWSPTPSTVAGDGQRS